MQGGAALAGPDPCSLHGKCREEQAPDCPDIPVYMGGALGDARTAALPSQEETSGCGPFHMNPV